ncbi:MAG: hypothetical protein AAF682_03155 [Planctomycetota bacterium]
MTRILTVAALLILVVFGATTLREMLLSDETKIRNRILDAAEAFNDARPGSAVAPLADDWRARPSGVTKQELHQILVGLVLQEKDAEGDFLYAVDVPEESLAVELVEEGKAKATLVAHFTRRVGDAPTPKWSVSIDAELRDGDDGWEIQRTEHTTLSGSPR